MCGIAGIFSANGIYTSDLILMSSALQHRGPDGYGYMLYSQSRGLRTVINDDISKCDPEKDIVGFAHRRLSIIDLSDAGFQPMKDESNTYCVTYNGEIYNYLDLKEELKNLGYSFKTNSDTEVLLRAYEAWGCDCMKRFNGMWAFILIDIRNQCLIISRDRFGIKPLYYAIRNGTLYFSSEIKGLLAIPFFEKKPDQSTVAKYLLTGHVDDTNETFFNGIFQFPSAHRAVISLKTNNIVMKTEPYWLLPEGTYRGTEQDAITEFRELFINSLKIHAKSDVPVGTCLSGGLDSSSIVCASDLLRRSYQIPNYTHSAFGYCPPEEDYSEKKYMDVVVKETGAKMNYIDFSQDKFQEALPLIIRFQDEPFASASIAAQWFVFEKAKEEGMTVMLDGQGADEILAGYHTYFATIGLNLLLERKLLSFLRLRSIYEKEIGNFPLSFRFLPIGVILGILPPQFSRLWKPAIRMYRKISGFSHTRYLFPNSLIQQYPLDPFTTKLRSLKEELKMQLQSTGLPGLLRYEDRNSMAHSIEARVPFLDYRLVEFLFSLPDDLKIKGVTTKYILREAMKGILPEAIRSRRDKMGFRPNPNLTFGFVQKYAKLFKENITGYEKLWFDEKGLEIILKKRDRSVSFEFLLWRIINTKLWARQNWDIN